MKINEVNIPKNNENGLSEIKMIKLENVVCIAGQNGSGKSRLIDAIWGLSECDEEFKTKFKQLLNETKQRFQKEFDEL